MPISCCGLKYRKKLFVCGIDTRLNELIIETARLYEFKILDMEVMPDHVHMIIDCDPEKGIIDCIRKIKSPVIFYGMSILH